VLLILDLTMLSQIFKLVVLVEIKSLS